MPTFQEIVILFVIYSVIGYFCEVIYCSIGQKKLVNRGFLYGPYCPIYGCGAILVLLTMLPFKENFFMLLISAFIVPTSVEYITGWILEKSFNMKWWDYSNKKFNINGRVCLLNSVLFALLSIFLVYIAHPFVSSIISPLSVTIKTYLSTGLIILFFIDIIATLNQLINLEEKILQITFIINNLKEFQEEYVNLNFDEIQNEIKNIKETAIIENDSIMLKTVTILENFTSKTYDSYKLLRNYPRATIKYSEDAFSKIKNTISKSNEKLTDKINKSNEKITGTLTKSNLLITDTVDSLAKKTQDTIHDFGFALKEKPSTKHAKLYNYFWIFMSGSITGYLMETLFVFIVKGVVENRQNLLFGPLNIIYGFTSIFLYLIYEKILNPKKTRIFVASGTLSLVSMAVNSIVLSFFLNIKYTLFSESGSYLTRQLILEKSLYFMLTGFLGMIIIRLIAPFIINLMKKVPIFVENIFLWSIMVFMIINISATSYALIMKSNSSHTSTYEEYFGDDYIDEIFPHIKVK